MRVKTNVRSGVKVEAHDNREWTVEEGGDIQTNAVRRLCRLFHFILRRKDLPSSGRDETKRRKWDPVALGILCLALGSGSLALAQQSRETEKRLVQKSDAGGAGIGARVRVTLAETDSELVGDIIEIDEQTLTLMSEHRRIVPLPRDLIRRLEISQGRRGHGWWGLAIGLAAGAAIGAAEKPDDQSCVGENCYSRAENVAYGALGAGLIGALVGALYTTDQWIEVPSDHLQLKIGPNRLGPGLSVTLLF